MTLSPAGVAGHVDYPATQINLSRCMRSRSKPASSLALWYAEFSFRSPRAAAWTDLFRVSFDIFLQDSDPIGESLVSTSKNRNLHVMPFLFVDAAFATARSERNSMILRLTSNCTRRWGIEPYARVVQTSVQLAHQRKPTCSKCSLSSSPSKWYGETGRFWLCLC